MGHRVDPALVPLFREVEFQEDLEVDLVTGAFFPHCHGLPHEDRVSSLDRQYACAYIRILRFREFLGSFGLHPAAEPCGEDLCAINAKRNVTV